MMGNQRVKQIVQQAKQIEKRLKTGSDAGDFNLEELEEMVNGLTTLLPGVPAHLAGLQKTREKIEIESQNLQVECDRLEKEIKKTDKNLEEKNRQYQELKDILFQIQQPDTKRKSGKLKELQDNLRVLENEVSAKEKELKPLQQEYDAYKAIETEISRVINETRNEENKILLLETDIEKFKMEWEKIANDEIPKVKKERDLLFLIVLRFALKAEHKNLKSPHRDELLEMLAQIPGDTPHN